MPLIVYWEKGILKGGRVVKDFVSTSDLAPTFLDAAGIPIPETMSARSLMPWLASTKSGQILESRDYIVTGRERHCPAQPDSWGGYPMRSIRTKDFLYIRNYEPDRWPQGNYPTFVDIDASACKNDYVANWNNPEYRDYMALLQKQPEEILYDLRQDPNQLKNVAGSVQYAAVKKELTEKMISRLQSVDDPRISAEGWRFDAYEWFTGWQHPAFGGTWRECGQEGL